MRAHDLRDAFLEAIQEHTDWVHNAEVNYPEWRKVKLEAMRILGDAGDEAKCSHPDRTSGPFEVCLICGRRPTPENTLEESHDERSSVRKA